jgi:redox-regulated HSP33 family molecular chaperone
MSDRTSFSSRCPKCGELRYLEGLSQDKLRHLLDAHHHIEGHCPTCNERWALNERERAEIAQALPPGRNH